MKTRLRLCITSLALSCTAAYGGDDPKYTIYDARPAHVIQLELARELLRGSALPLNKRYAELTPEQQQMVRKPYIRMDAGDEPPFPAAGLEAIYGPITQIQKKLLLEGEVQMFVRVGADGRGKSVDVLKAPKPEVGRLLANLLMLVPYKPALCAGIPCEMDFPLNLSLSVE